jgi:hypothetical protein
MLYFNSINIKPTSSSRMSKKLFFVGQADTPIPITEDGLYNPNIVEMKYPVKAECHLHVPLNTVVQPMELRIDHVVFTPRWYELRDLSLVVYDKSVYPAAVREVFFPPSQYTDPAEVMQMMADNIIIKFPAATGEQAQLRLTPRFSNGTELSVLKLAPHCDIVFSENFVKRFSLRRPDISNNTDNVKQIHLEPRSAHMDIFHDTHLLKSDQLQAIYVKDKTLERIACEFQFGEVEDSSEMVLITPDSAAWVPLEAMLHQEKLIMYLSKLSTSTTPIYVSNYKLLITATIRPIQQHQA